MFNMLIIKNYTIDDFFYDIIKLQGGVKMNNLKKVPVFAWIVLLIITILLINIYFNNNRKLQQKNTFEYESNNSYNSEFEYEDIENAELAVYDKYIDPKAEELILNQKIYVKIESIDEFSDESSATQNKYTAIANDQKGNKWKLISYDDKSYVKSDIKNIKIYGLYRGIDKNNSKKIPVIEVYTQNIDSDYIDKKKYKEISKKYIDKLNSSYSKEKFRFDSFDEWTNQVAVVYKNENNEIELTVFIDVEKELVTEIGLCIENASIDFEDIDREFLYSVITSYDSALTNNDAETMLIMAEADALFNSTPEHLEITENQPMTPGMIEHKNNKMTIIMFSKSITLEKLS